MLNKKLVLPLAISFALIPAVPPVFAQAGQRQPPPTQQPSQSGQTIYGSQLMTPQERNEYRARMRAAKTVEEREKIRSEHHQRMQERAKEQGITLPDQPPARGGGPGMGPGMGMGPGQGMGPGPGSPSARGSGR